MCIFNESLVIWLFEAGILLSGFNCLYDFCALDHVAVKQDQ